MDYIMVCYKVGLYCLDSKEVLGQCDLQLRCLVCINFYCCYYWKCMLVGGIDYIMVCLKVGLYCSDLKEVSGHVFYKCAVMIE